MAPDVAPSLERLIDHYLPVEAAGIEEEFERIWRDASSGSYDSSSIRLRVSNVVVWGDEAEAEGRFEQLMHALAQRHPCRGILASFSDQASALESAISAHCWRTASGGRHICSEEIVLRVARGGERTLASALLALLVPELPVHVWVVGPPDTALRLPEELIRVVDRIYVDSAAAPTAPTLASLGEQEANEPVVVDLAWRRGAAWRDLIAQFFDSAAAAAELERLTHIDVEGGAQDVSSDALLLAGWLASRLGLSAANVAASPGEIRATFYDGLRAVALRVAAAGSAGPITRVVLATEQASWLVELHPESGHLHARAEFETEPVHRTVAPESGDDADVVSLALDDNRGPALYRDAVSAALVLLGA